MPHHGLSHKKIFNADEPLSTLQDNKAWPQSGIKKNALTRGTDPKINNLFKNGLFAIKYRYRYQYKC